MGRTGSVFVTVTVAVLIALVCLLYLAIATTGSGSAEWQLQVAGPIDSLSVGSENVLYAFHGNSVTAISPGGQVKWTYSVPASLNVTLTSLYAEDQGCMYVYAINNSTYNRGTPVFGNIMYDVLAISPSGRMLWGYSIPDPTSSWDSYLTIAARDDRIYLYHNYTETVLDSDGHFLFNIDNVFAPAAIDEAGYMYVVSMGNNSANIWHFDNYTGSINDMFPSRTIEAYGPDGMLWWRKDMGDYIHMSTQMGMPMYRNGTICLLAGTRAIALDRNGNELWSYDFGTEDIRLNEQMQSDAAGNLYVDAGNERLHLYPCTYVVNFDNRSVSAVKIPSSVISYAYLGHVHLYNQLINGICYQTNTTDIIEMQPIAWSFDNIEPGVKKLTDINAITVTATDLQAGRTLWTFTVPATDARTGIINESNVGLIFPSLYLKQMNSSGENLSLRITYPFYSLYVDHNSTPVSSWSNVDVLPGYGVTYLVVNDVNYEPVTFNQSLCHYINGIYALNETGQVLWYRPADARIEQAAAGNGTIYYSTGGGKIFAGSTGVVSGVAVLAMAYVFLRFFLIGAVSRARSRLDRNENRNRVYRYIADNPGLTLYDISRDLQINVGTARYHLMILGINHRIVTGKAFGKYARYFTNSGSHSPDDQLLYSALRRQGIKNILGLLVERPGLSNREIAGELQMRESAASRYMKELTSIGLVERRNRVEGRHEYYIHEQYEEALASTMKTNAGKMF
ncbi:MAG TPA: PQQ-binding-like beta-propeller repeat protein [Methanocella sp.]